MQDLDALLSKLFPCGVTLETTGDVCAGIGELADGPVVLVGTRNEAFIGAEIAHALTGHILAAMRDHPGRPILMLVDNAGQRLSRRDEMLGNNAYLANLAKALDVARRRGHVVLSLVYGRAVSGGFLACGMSAEGCLAPLDVPGRETERSELAANSVGPCRSRGWANGRCSGSADR